jgi:DNA repair protein RAD51
MATTALEEHEELQALQQNEEEYGPLSISRLEEHGIAAADVKRLIEGGFFTVESIAYTPRKALLQV